MKKFLALGLLLGIFACGVQPEKPRLTNASYEGCEHIKNTDAQFECFNKKLGSYLADAYTYPEAARSLGVEGKIYVNFVVEADGSIDNIKVVKGLDALLDAEAVRAVRSLPKMIPATYDGKPVRIQYTVPINASLK